VEALRLATPADVPAIADLYRSLSPESARMRFSSLLPPEAADEFAALGPGARAFVVELRGRVVAEGRYLPAGGTHEFSLTVADEYQRLGYGPRLLNRLREDAREHGIGSLRAMVRVDNMLMLRLLQKVGCAVVEPVGGGVAVVDVATDDLMPAWPPSDKRPRVLIESHGLWDDAATTALRAAGYDVRRCLLGRQRTRPCPLLTQGRCRLAEGADIVACLLPGSEEQTAGIADEHAKARRLAATSVHEWEQAVLKLLE
jgi:GNAT superfamily N-acetyltransferase